ELARDRLQLERPLLHDQHHLGRALLHPLRRQAVPRQRGGGREALHTIGQRSRQLAAVLALGAGDDDAPCRVGKAEVEGEEAEDLVRGQLGGIPGEQRLRHLAKARVLLRRRLSLRLLREQRGHFAIRACRGTGLRRVGTVVGGGRQRRRERAVGDVRRRSLVHAQARAAASEKK